MFIIVIIIIIIIGNAAKTISLQASFGDLIIIRNGAKTLSLQTSFGDLIRNRVNTRCLPKLRLGDIIRNGANTTRYDIIWLPNDGYQFSLKSENIEILSILSAAKLKMAAIRSQFFLVRIFYQPYLIYMPSLVEIPLAVSDISEVKDFDICS